ncbi:peptide chain release factor N(5)-glutamine methyltransferase [Timonella sp. A28]|uniref:peptide chain release factor N(5)-glutamine methyltransferase n=1 Tax=Timonella sp. A28 TaxID=3442640 RepID=UPI003EC0E90E
MTPTVREVINDARARLEEHGVENARVDAELLYAHVMNMSRSDVLRGVLMEAPAWTGTGTNEEQEFQRACARRCMREPLQHITGSAHFRHIELAVGPGVFVPRPETEVLVQVALDYLAAEFSAVEDVRPLVVDLCTGSGAIALSIATEFPTAQVHGVELDHQAFVWTQRNNATYSNMVSLTQGDARTVLQDLNNQVHVVISNPPYVPPDAVPKDREVAEYDPQIALYGLGHDGLEVPRGIMRSAARLLVPHGLFVMEHAEVQGAQVRDMLSATGYFERVETLVDLTNRPRMVVARRNNSPYREGSPS